VLSNINKSKAPPDPVIPVVNPHPVYPNP